MRENEDVVGRFEAHVEQIQHLAQMSFYQDLLSTIVEKAELKSGEKVLDVGSGPGWLTIRAAKRVGEVGKVFGIDISPRMPNGVPKGVQSQENGDKLNKILDAIICLSGLEQSDWSSQRWASEISKTPTFFC